jgi:phenylacetate-CoA ligase
MEKHSTEQDKKNAEKAIEQFIHKLIPESELKPKSIDAVSKLPSFLDKMKACETHFRTRYAELDHDIQDAVVLRRLQQMTNTLLLNPLWKDRLAQGGVTTAPENFEEWQNIPISDKNTVQDFFSGTRPGMVVPIENNGFEIVASGGTSSGIPSETVYSLRELHDTYKIAGDFMGKYQLSNYLKTDLPKWVVTTLADYQMWSSGTMVGGVLQHIPGVNYIGAGPIRQDLFQHMMNYSGLKVFMGITRGIALLSEFATGLSEEARNSLVVGMYGSGVLSEYDRCLLKTVYPNINILSYFAATQAETIGLQLDAEYPELAAIPGLHLIEIVDKDGKWVKEGEEGDLVVTRLHAHEAPVPRFKIGDKMVRRPNIDGKGLKTQQFEFAGRSADIIHLGDTQFPALPTYESLSKSLVAGNILDLPAVAKEIQIINNRKNRTLTILAAVDDAEEKTSKLNEALENKGTSKLVMEALTKSLSLFNKGEASTDYLEHTGYKFELKLVNKDSEEIFRTTVGKTPLLRDII